MISDSLIQLSKGSCNDKHVFLVHAGSGEIGAYRELCSNLDKEYNYWGIRLSNFNDLCPKNIEITKFALNYINMIKKIQPVGPYYILGWCIGGTIAFEMARLLENNNEKVNFLALINTIPPMFWDEIEYFDIKSEKLFLSKYFNLQDIENYIFEIDKIENLWCNVLEHLERANMHSKIRDTLKCRVPASVISAIPRFEELSMRDIIYYFNVIRTLHNSRARYFPDGRINTQIHFFKSAQDDIVEDEGIWNKYCTNTIKVHKVEGGHVSMFSHPYVKALSDKVNILLKP